MVLRVFHDREGDGTGMSLTCAVFFWSDRLRKLLTDFVAAPVAG